MLSRAWRRVRASSSTSAAGEGTKVEVDSAQCRGWNPTAQGPLVTVGPVAPPGPGDFCSAAPVAPAGPTSSAPPWEKTLTPGSAVTAATLAPVRGAAGGTGSPGPRGHHSQLGSGDRRRAVTRGGKECGMGLLCSSSPCPLQCPPLKPSQTPAPRLRDPRAVPRLLALWLR